MLSLHASYHNAAYVTVFLTQPRNTFLFLGLMVFIGVYFWHEFLKTVSLLIERRVDNVLT